MKKVLIVGSGFAGLNTAKELAGVEEFDVTLIDRNNYHLFQPLLYQVATAGLSPAEIAVPIRSLFSKYRNIKVLQANVMSVKSKRETIETDVGEFPYDYLVLACGSRHVYFDHKEWEEHAPGLKTIEQALEIRRRILMAFEQAETEPEFYRKRRLLTFVIVGGGSTGVELAGAIGELSRFTFAKDFKNIDPTLARIILVEAGPKILPAYSEKMSRKALNDLKKLGVDVHLNCKVTDIDEFGIRIGDECIESGTVLWAAGIRASEIGRSILCKQDTQGRIIVEPDLSIKDNPRIFVAGDQAHFSHNAAHPLPAIAPVALQQGKWIARMIIEELRGKSREPFVYKDKGHLSTIGRRKAVLEIGRIKISGFMAWIMWLIVHIYYLMGFKNRLFVFLQWATSYLNYRKGARLIIKKDWQFYTKDSQDT